MKRTTLLVAAALLVLGACTPPTLPPYPDDIQRPRDDPDQGSMRGDVLSSLARLA
jgi:hypothetical protein